MTEASTTANTAATTASSGPKISPSAEDWFLGRGISRPTLELLPVASGTTFFPGLNAKSEGVFFKFSDGWKARSIPEKEFVSSKGWKPSLWNLENVLEYLTSTPSPTVFLTEGELDAISLVEAGIPTCQVLSVPNGAGNANTGPSTGGVGISPWLEAGLKAGLARAKKIIWCGDMDPAGLALRQTMAHQIGVAKFYVIDWKNGCKDANEVLLKNDPLYLRNTVLNEAKPMRVEGLFSMAELPEPPPLTVWTPSIDCMTGVVNFAPTCLSIVTGQPGHGKSVCMGQIWFEISRKYNVPICMASFETRPKPYIRRQIRTLFHRGKKEFDQTPDELRQADEFIEQHYRFINHPDETPELEWILDMAEVAVIRHGCKVLQIDPWNRLEDTSERNEKEHKYILRCLKAMAVFAKDMNCHVQVIAHPAKMDGFRMHEAPALEDISGSKAWDTVPDQGLVIHRKKIFENNIRQTEADFYVRKARFAELGYPCQLALNYDLRTDTYVGVSLPAGGVE